MSAFEELGLVPFAGTPVVYEGRASRSQLQSLFARYAAAGVAAGLDEEGGVTEEGEAVDLAAVDTLQALFQISDKQADRLAQQVVTCVEINQSVGCTDNSSLSHFSAVRNQHRHAIEQASRRWRGDCNTNAS